MPAWAFAAVDLWRACNRGMGMFGGALLPAAGGMGDQPAALIDAFDILDHWKAERKTNEHAAGPELR